MFQCYQVYNKTNWSNLVIMFEVRLSASSLIAILIIIIKLSGKPDIDPSELQTDGRYNHTVQVQERLNFLRYDSAYSSGVYYNG